MRADHQNRQRDPIVQLDLLYLLTLLVKFMLGRRESLRHKKTRNRSLSRKTQPISKENIGKERGIVMQVILCAYKLSLNLLPKDFRDNYRDEMIETASLICESASKSGILALIKVGASILADSFYVAYSEKMKGLVPVDRGNRPKDNNSSRRSEQSKLEYILDLVSFLLTATIVSSIILGIPENMLTSLLSQLTQIPGKLIVPILIGTRIFMYILKSIVRRRNTSYDSPSEKTSHLPIAPNHK